MPSKKYITVVRKIMNNNLNMIFITIDEAQSSNYDRKITFATSPKL